MKDADLFWCNLIRTENYFLRKVILNLNTNLSAFSFDSDHSRNCDVFDNFAILIRFYGNECYQSKLIYRTRKITDEDFLKYDLK